MPWSCCVAQFLAAEEEKERKLNEPEALANTIRARLLEKSQVRTFTYLIKSLYIHKSYIMSARYFATMQYFLMELFFVSFYCIGAKR